MDIVCTSGSPAGRTLADDLQTEGARIHDGLARIHDGLKVDDGLHSCFVVEEGSLNLELEEQELEPQSQHISNTLATPLEPQSQHMSNTLATPLERLSPMFTEFCAAGAVVEDDVYRGVFDRVEVFLDSIAQEILQFHTELDAAGVPQAVNDSRVITALPGDMAELDAAGVPQAVTDLWRTDSSVTALAGDMAPNTEAPTCSLSAADQQRIEVRQMKKLLRVFPKFKCLGLRQRKVTGAASDVAPCTCIHYVYISYVRVYTRTTLHLCT